MLNRLQKVQCATCLKLCPKHTAHTADGGEWLCKNCSNKKEYKIDQANLNKKVYCESCRESVPKKLSMFKSGLLVCKNCAKLNLSAPPDKSEKITHTKLLSLEELNKIFNEGKDPQFIFTTLSKDTYQQREQLGDRNLYLKKRSRRLHEIRQQRQLRLHSKKT